MVCFVNRVQAVGVSVYNRFLLRRANSLCLLLDFHLKQRLTAAIIHNLDS